MEPEGSIPNSQELSTQWRAALFLVREAMILINKVIAINSPKFI
jgi:hypothetical protein